MGRKYDFRLTDGTGTTDIPVADGDFFTGDIDPAYDRGQCCLAFYNVAGELATPTGGTIIFRASCIAGQFLRDSVSTTIQANTVIAGDATYTIPVFNGPAERAKMTLSGVTGGGVVTVRAHYFASEG